MTGRVLIAGGVGFLGSHFCDRFLADGYDVLCLDNLCTGRLANIEHLRHNVHFDFMQQDVSEPFDITGKLEFILHLASPASPPDYYRLPIETLLVGSQGTRILLDLAERKGARFLLASTSEIYGDPEEHPQRETYWGHVNPIGIRSVYDEAKRFAEALTCAYRRSRRVDTRIARIFNTYGERMRDNDGRAIPSFVTQALRNEPVTVFGDGSQTRSVCYVSDEIEGLYRLLRSDYDQPVNIGNADETSMLDLAREVMSLIPSTTSQIVFQALPLDDPQVRRPDSSLARSLLGWSPSVSRTDGLRRTIAYFAELEARKGGPTAALQAAS